MLKKIGIISLAAASAMAMHSFSLNINDVDLETGVELDMGQFNEAVEPNTTFIGVKYLKIDSDYSSYNDPSAYVEASFKIQRQIKDTNLFAGLGVKLNYINNDGNNDFMSLPLSMKFGYKADTELPVYVSLEGFYAPKVLSLQEAEGYYEYRFNIEVELIPNANVNIGFRDMETKYETTTGYGSSYIKYNRSAYVGFVFKF